MELFQSTGSILLSVFTFLVIFGILIILHEFGHFWAARAAKVKVLEFGFGMPPKIFGKKTSRNTTDGTEEMEWTINAIPFGGFVRMEGENGNSEHPRAFHNRPLLWRMLVICGGVIMNFLLGWGLLTVSFMTGVQVPESGYGSIQIGKLIENMPASSSELHTKDTILTIDGKNITSYEDFLSVLKQDAEKKHPAHFTVLRENDTKEIDVTPNENGLFGIVPQFKIKEEQYGFLDASKKSFTESLVIMKSSIDSLINLVNSLTTKHEIPEGIGGPVAIASVTDTIVEHGTFLQLVLFTATLSLSLAVLNIMPFPGLDGGRFLFLLIEAVFLIFRYIATKILKLPYTFPTKLPQTLEMYINGIGLILLFAFLIWITIIDIGKLLG